MYDFAMDQAVPNTLARLKTALCFGPITGLFAIAYLVIESLTLMLCEWLLPESEIDIARNFNVNEYQEKPVYYGDHLFKVDSRASPVIVKQTDSSN